MKDLLLSPRALPMTLMIDGTALLGLLANEEYFPSVADVDLSDNLTVSAKIKDKNGTVSGKPTRRILRPHYVVVLGPEEPIPCGHRSLPDLSSP